jgi:hypothetical protein
MPGASFAETNLAPQIVAFYDGQVVRIILSKLSAGQLAIGQVILSKTGQELTGVCGCAPQEGFLEYIVERWRGFGHEVVAPGETGKETTGSAQPPETG